nr:C25 family cysteine peptidase [uncultured Dyadobacter sp.]
MNKCTFTKILFSVLIVSLGLAGKVVAQSWNGFYGNDWLQGKYAQKWLRIGISAKGIHRVTLPPGFMVGSDPNVLHLYYHGTEVALTAASTTEIEFYGVPNDGSSDSLLYRPYSSRVNPYYSMFSDESAYFLTIGSPNGKRAIVENLSDPTGADVLTHHVQTDNVNYQTEYSHATQYPTRPTNLNSFMEDGQTRSGDRLPDTDAHPIYSSFPILLKKQFGSDAPKVEALVHGRSNYAPNGLNPRNVHIHIGPNAGALRHVTQVAIDGFMYGKFSFDVQPGDLTAGAGTLGFNLDSPKQGVAFDRFSVTYYNVIYKQQIDMQGLDSYLFTFPAAAQNSKSKITVATPPGLGTVKFYDISDPVNPRVINGTVASTIFSRPTNKPLLLWATNTTNIVANEKVSTVTFPEINKSDYDYMIVSNETLMGSSASFAAYRKDTSPGRKYKTGVFKIKDLYNLFNFGEPSPLAIRRFVDFMVSDGNKDKYLLLMGKAVTRNDKITKELPDEVPTFGFPGSDLLLIEGLQGTDKDVPVIPVGRIPAISDAQAIAYLNKVIEYEGTTTGLAWRKNIAHISGGKNQIEIDDHATNLNTAANKARGGVFGGKIYPAKKPQAVETVIQMDTLNKHVNYPPVNDKDAGGVGMITYFGHSVPYQTDYNFGYVSNINKNFNNPGKYPIMFYNGCDILNVFSNNFLETVDANTSRPQSLDWLLSANKGAIAVFGNSWAGYASSCNNYMQRVYTELFTKNDQNRQPLGKVLQIVAQQTKTSVGFRMGAENARTAEVYIQDQAQVHQTVYLGDPALKVLLTTEGGLPVELISFDAQPSSNNQVNVTWKTSSEVNNSHFVIERSYNAKNFEAVGRVEGKGDSNAEAAYNFIDNKPLPGISYYRLKQVDFTTTNANGQKIDGESTYSRIVSVVREGTSLVTIFPNPVSETAEILLDQVVKLKQWSLLGVDGTPRKTGKGSKIDLSNLPSGTYLVKIATENDDVYYQKIIKK